MANYTISIEDILELNKQPGESLDNLSDLCTVAKRALFNKCDLTVIDADYIDRFVTQFAIHYLDHEICCPSEFKWRIYLAGHVMENAELINSIFEELEKQIFADYNTRTVTTTINETVQDDGTVENDGTVTNVKTGDDTVKNTGTSANAKTGTETGAHTGTDTQVKSGDDTLKRTGQSSDSHTGQNTHRTLGDDTLTKSGSEITGYGSGSTNTRTGSETDSGGEVSHTEQHTDDTKKRNAGQFFQDTPMDELMNMRSTKDTPPQPYNATGKGILAASESDMKYLTNATLNDSTDVTDNDVITDVDASDSSTTHTYNQVQDVNTKNGQDTLSFNQRQDAKHVDTTITDGFNESNTKTDNLQDKTEYNSTTQATKNLTDTTTFNTNDTRTDNLQSKTEYNTEDTRTDDLTTTKHNTNVKTGENVVTEVSNKLNWELLMRCEAPMNKVWRAFDEIFWPLW